jgi:hypothetical protein
VCLALALLGAGCFDVIALRPELRAAATKRDAEALAEALEDLIDRGMATPDDRRAAYEAIKEWRRPTAEYAYARASIAGRLAQVRGLTAIKLVAEVERWARYSLAIDPKYREGAARRMLGTLYVLAPARFLDNGDSEKGLELLQRQVKEYPRDPVNHLRVAEAFISLNDPTPSVKHLCYARDHARGLRISERRLLAALIEQIGGTLDCDAPEESDEYD